MIYFSEFTVWKCKLPAATSDGRNHVSHEPGRGLVAAHQEVFVPFQRLRLGFGGSDEVQEIAGVIQRVVVYFGVHVVGVQQLDQAVAFQTFEQNFIIF